jgi:hypothetical protein
MATKKRAPRTANRFNQREVARAMRAVTDTGAAVERVEVDPASGKISVILKNKDAPPTDDDEPNPWLADLSNKGKVTER